jgi:hypothetical protein
MGFVKIFSWTPPASVIAARTLNGRTTCQAICPFLSEKHIRDSKVFISLYGGYATKLLRLQLDMIQALDRHRRGNQQTVEVRHVHIYPGWLELLTHPRGMGRLQNGL